MSFQLRQPQDRRQAALAQPLLTDIAAVTTAVEAAEGVQKEVLVELGSYLHRTSPVILELQASRNPPASTARILRSLATNVDLAKDVMSKLSDGEDFENSISRMEKIINDIGYVIGKIPASAFGDSRYVETATRSLSEEMRGASLLPYSQNWWTSESGDVEDCRSSVLSQHTTTSSEWTLGMHLGLQYRSSESGKLSQVAESSEPLYESFTCPLSKKMMLDPVTIESGATFERAEILRYFDKFKSGTETPVCPVTGAELRSTAVSSNPALRSIISEWVARNEAAQIKAGHANLSSGTSDDAAILETVEELNLLARGRKQNRELMHSAGVTKLLARLVESKNLNIRCKALGLLAVLVQDDEGKVIVADTRVIARAVKMTASCNSAEKHVALSLLVELSKSDLLLEKIGSISGCILILITAKYNGDDNAGKVLANLEKFPRNVKLMAENGYTDPLFQHLINGPEEVKAEMVSYLGELISEQDLKISIASSVSEILLKMVRDEGNDIVGKAALRALVHISSHRPNSKMLVDAGAIPVMIEEMFLVHKIDGCDHDHLLSKEKAAAVVANILDSGVDPGSLVVNQQGHSIASHYSIYNIIHLMTSAAAASAVVPDQLNLNLLRILLALTQHQKPLNMVAAAIRNTSNFCRTIVEFIDSPMEELSVVSAKLLIALSSVLGHMISDIWCQAGNQTSDLILRSLDSSVVLEKHVVVFKLLAQLPHQNLKLNLLLVRQGIVLATLRMIHEIQHGKTPAWRYLKTYLEGLVGILVRLPSTLYDQDILGAVRDHNLIKIFAELLARTSDNDEVQRLAAIGLERLSSQSMNLSKPLPSPEAAELMRPNKTALARVFTLSSKSGGRRNQVEKRVEQPCPIHGGICSAATTFCLLEAGAVEKLLGCLEHESVRVVEAALGALLTLLDERVQVQRSAALLAEMDAAKHVLRTVRDHREDSTWRKCFILIEKLQLYGGERAAKDIAADRFLLNALVTAAMSKDEGLQMAAGNVLRHLNRLPEQSVSII